MADKQIKVKVDVDVDAEPSIAQLKALKKELKNTAAGSEDFMRLQQAINDMEDSIKSAKTGASNFTEVLGQLPGPIGDVGNKVSGAVNTLKQFGGIKLTDLKASFVELGKDLGDAAKGLGNLTGITKVYTVLNGALAKSFQAVGIAEGAAAAGAATLSAALVATGIGALVVALGLAFNALKEFVTGEEEAKRAAEEANRAFETQAELLSLDLADSARRGKKRLADLKSQGATEAELRVEQRKQLEEQLRITGTALDENRALQNKIMKEGTGDLRKVQDEETKLMQKQKDIKADIYVSEKEDIIATNKEKDDAQKKANEKTKAANDKRIAEANRRKEELKKIKEQELNEITKGEEEAFKSTLAEREKTEYEINQKYSALVSLAVKHNKDTTLLEAGRQAELATMRDKFAKEDADKKKELDDKETERLKKKAEDDRGIILLGLQTKLEALDAENKKVDGDFQQDLERLAQQREILAEQEATELQNTDLTEFQKTEIRKKYADARMAITDQEVATEKAAAQAKHEINMAYLGLFEQFGNVLGQVAGKNKGLAIAGIVISQAAAIGQIIANTAIANAKSVAASPLTAGMPWVAINTISAGLSIASTIASAVKSIQQINQAASQAGVTGGSGGSVSAPSTAPPSAPKVAGVAAPQINTTGGQNPTQMIGETISRAQAPIKTYVVSGDVSTQQALDRRTSRAATFAGG